MTLAPGRTSLAALGELHNLPKIELPFGTISKMDQLLKDDPDLFEQYAIPTRAGNSNHVGVCLDERESASLINQTNSGMLTGLLVWFLKFPRFPW